MTKYALVTDSHAGARGDSLLFNEYFFKFWEGTFFPYLKEHGITNVIHLGDLVDRRKFINFGISDSWHLRFFKPLQDMGIKMKVIIGNHDTFHKNSNDINCMNQIFYGYDNVEIYSESQDVFLSEENPTEPTAFIPWINSGNYKRSLDFIATTKAEVAFGHLEITGFEMDRGVVCDSGFNRNTFDKFDRVFSGHFHHSSDDGTIKYLGNTYQITWADHGETRGFHIYDTERRELSFVPNPNTMFHKFVYDDSTELGMEAIRKQISENFFDQYKGTYVKIVVVHKNDPKLYDIVLDQIYRSAPADISVSEDYNAIDVSGEVDESQLGEDTITVLNKYVESLASNNALPASIESNKIKTLLRELYVEALNETSTGTDGE